MESIIIATYNEYADAQQGLSKLLELEQLDDLTLYTLAMVHKKQDGQVELLFYDGPDAKELPVAGAVIGTLVGVIGGPIGMIVGMMAGGITGSLDKYHLDTATQQFLLKVRFQLKPDRYALVMDVEEWNARLIDTYLASCHGVVTRSILTGVYSNDDQKEWQALTQEMSPKAKALEKAFRKDKKIIQTKIQKQLKHKIEKLNQKLSTAQGNRKENLHARRYQLQKKLQHLQEQHAGQHP